MRISSQLLLTFLLNACWQIALITALAAFGSWLLRNSVARYQHWLWVSALCLSFAVPAITSLRTLGDTVSLSTPTFDTTFVPQRFSVGDEPVYVRTTAAAAPTGFHLNQTLGFGLLSLYGAFLLYRIFKLLPEVEAQAIWSKVRSHQRPWTGTWHDFALLV